MKSSGITKDFLYSSSSKIYEEEPRYNETSLYKFCQSLVPFVVSRFHFIVFR